MLSLNRRRRSLIGFLTAVMLLATGAARTTAQEVLESGALQVAPADSAFYFSLLRTAEQIKIFRDSKLYAALRHDPFIQVGVAQLRAQLESDDDFRQLLEIIRQPENQQLLTLLKEAVSDEIFMYGDASFADQIALLNKFNGIVRSAQFQSLQGGDVERETQQKVMAALLEHVDQLAVPQLVIGLRIKDQQAAQAQLGRLESVIRELLADEPELEPRFSRKKIGEGDYVVFAADGSLIPWDELPREEFEGDPQQRETLIDRLKQITAVAAVGIYRNYLIVSLGKDETHLSQLGKGEPLASRSEFEPLKKFADQRLTEVSYASREFLQTAANIEGQLGQFEAMIEGVLPTAGLSSELEQKARALIGELLQELSAAVPDPGAVMSLAFLTPRGYEKYEYNWTKSSQLDDSQPLTILNHIGGEPIAWAAVRSRKDPEGYAKVREWFQRIFELGDEIALEKLNQDDVAVYRQVRERMRPLLRRLSEVNQTLLGPALEGQTAFVFDARLTSVQPHAAMPAARQALPIPELAVVCSLKDREKLKQAASEYFRLAQEALNALAEISPDEFPQIQLPKPERTEIQDAEAYAYPLPAAAQVDENLKPNAAVSDDVLVISLSPQTTARLLPATEPDAREFYTREQGNIAAAGSFQFAALIDALLPWIDYGIVQTQGEDTAPIVGGILRNYFEMLKCYRGVRSITYREDDAWVKHSEVHLSDLP